MKRDACNRWMRTLLVVGFMLWILGGPVSGPGLARADERPDLVIGVSSLPENLRPSEISNTLNRIKLIFLDHLIRRDFGATPEGDGSELVPSLAESWTCIEPTVWEIKIRKGVKFHNGEEMSAEDVAFSFSADRFWGPNALEPDGKRYFDVLKKVEVAGPDTVRFETKAPDPIFPLRFSSPVSFVIPRKYYQESGLDKFALNPVGTGPYKLVAIKKGDYIKFEAHDAYWGGRPPAKTITLRLVPELAGRIAGLVSGQFHLIDGVSPDLVDTLSGYTDLEVRRVKIENQRLMVINTLHPLLKDKRVRQAIVHAIDRQKIIDTLWRGETVVPKPFNFPSYGKYYDPSRLPREYDPQKAMELLKAAGYKGEPLNFRVTKGYYVNYEDAAQIMVEMWKKVGLKVNLEIREGASLAWKGVREGEVALINWSSGIHFADPVTPLWVDWGPAGPRAYGPGKPLASWVVPEEFAVLGKKLELEMDVSERKKAHQRMVDIIEDECPAAALWMEVVWYGVRKNIKWKPYSFWYMDFGPGNLSFGR
jgi:peptide/nickel transport system substrate-binding protein